MSFDVLKVEQHTPIESNDLDPDLMDFCKRCDIQMQSDRHHNGSDSDSESSLPLENEDLHVDEIVEQSDLEKFCTFLKKAQIIALEAEGTNGTT